MFWRKILSKKCFFFVREEINPISPYYIYKTVIKHFCNHITMSNPPSRYSPTHKRDLSPPFTYSLNDFIRCQASLTHKTKEEPIKIIAQSSTDNPPLTILKNFCRIGSSTIAICPIKIIEIIKSNPRHPLKWSALRPVSKARALNR